MIVTPTAGGCYTNSAAVTSPVRNITVSSPVTPAATVPTASATTICSGQSAVLSANYTNMGANPGFQWYLNGVSINGATGASYNYTNAVTGTQNIHVVITPTAGGCYTNAGVVASPVVAITVKATIAPVGDVSPNTLPSQCDQSTVSHTFSFTGNGIETYTHEYHLITPVGTDNSSGNITPGTVISPVLTPGSWRIYIKSIRQSTNACAVATVYSDTVTIVINPLPVAPVIVQAGDLLSVQSPIAGAAYQWQKKNATSGIWENIAGATATTQSITATGSGEYRVQVTQNGCGPVASNTINAIVTAINPVPGARALSIYPNPVHKDQLLYITGFPQAIIRISAIITNISGQQVYNREHIIQNGQIKIEMGNLPAGLYILQLIDKNQKLKGYEKLILQ